MRLIENYHSSNLSISLSQKIIVAFDGATDFMLYVTITPIRQVFVCLFLHDFSCAIYLKLYFQVIMSSHIIFKRKI